MAVLYHTVAAELFEVWLCSRNDFINNITLIVADVLAGVYDTCKIVGVRWQVWAGTFNVKSMT
jgi:hypothetical protein